MGESVWGQALEIMLAVWVVWLCQQAGLWGLASVSFLVFQTEKLVCLVAGAVGGKPPSVPGAGNENICWLAWVLQQPGCWTLVFTWVWQSTFSKVQCRCRGCRLNLGGPSLVFCQKHEAGKTRICSHKFKAAKMCRKVLGYDAKALYPSTMLGDMPCSKEEAQKPGNVEKFLRFLQQDKWFGSAKVEIEVPRELWQKFEEMPPLFYNKPVPREAVPQHMKEYLACSNHKPMHDQQKVVDTLSAQKILLYPPLLKWLLDHALKITAMHRTIDYVPQKIFTWFVNKVRENRHKGDEISKLSLLVEVFKLLGNSLYGKLIKALESQMTEKYTISESVLRRAVLGVVSRFWVDWQGVWNRDVKAQRGYWQTLPGGDSGLPYGQAADSAVLLRVSEKVSRQARFLANPDGYWQSVISILWFFGKDGAFGAAGWVPNMKKKMVLLGQMEWARAWAVQAGVLFALCSKCYFIEELLTKPAFEFQQVHMQVHPIF